MVIYQDFQHPFVTFSNNGDALECASGARRLEEGLAQLHVSHASIIAQTAPLCSSARAPTHITILPVA